MFVNIIHNLNWMFDAHFQNHGLYNNNIFLNHAQYILSQNQGLYNKDAR